MHIVVCAKRIPDPEVSGVAFGIDPETMRREELPGLKMVMNPYDEQCFEAALRIREQLHEEVRITALSLGQDDDIKIFRQAFSWEAEEGIFLFDPAFVGGDGYATALALAAAVRKLGDVDLVLVGRLAADGDEGIVGFAIAELLDFPLLPCASDVRIDQGSVVIGRKLDEASEELSTRLPAVVTVSSEIGPPRQPNMRQIMQAGRKKPSVWTVEDIGLDNSTLGVAGARIIVENVIVPNTDRECEIISGDTSAAMAEQLIDELRERRVLP